MVDITQIGIATLFGLQLGMIYALIVVGFTLIFGMMDVINFAHGSLYMLGAYFGLTIAGITGNFWLAMLVAPLLVGVVGGVIHIFTIRPLRDRNPLYDILLTVGISFIIADAVLLIWGGNVQNISTPAMLAGTVSLGGFAYPIYRLFLFVFTAVLIGIIWYVLTSSDMGILMQACAHDEEMTSSLGVNVSRIFTVVFVISAILAGLAGVLLGSMQAIYPGMDVQVIILAFAIVVIGGLGDFRGAIIGSILVGLLISYGNLFIPSLTDVIPFVLMVIVLIVKPEGLLGNAGGA
jgi:branched-subunit amino acid ABC-type transport system permease component